MRVSTSCLARCHRPKSEQNVEECPTPSPYPLPEGEGNSSLPSATHDLADSALGP